MSDSNDSTESRPADAGAEIARAYDRWARTYDTDANTTRDLDADVLRQSSLAIDGRDVLEVGCGTGKNTRWLAARARRVVAMDFSPGMLDVARGRVPSERVTLVQHDIRERWPVDDASVDLVIGNLILEHVSNVAPIFAEAARVLRPGGVMYSCELHPYRQLRGGQAHFTDEWSGEVVFAPAFQHTIAEYVNAAIASGLSIQRLDEWTETGAASPAIPRLLSLQLRR
ncbi:MAG TPA: methyltransferase domain-containing protein [Gemmatimonadaceae bacterium]|nr:methyltransferase domain-containing protein [Gemmatimonadaceae bacterium]